MLKKLIVAICLALPMLAAAQTVKIGIVDTTTVVEGLESYKTATAKLKDISDKYETEYKKLGEELQRKYEEYQALDADTPEATKKLKEEDITATNTRMTQFYEAAQTDITKQRETLLAPIMASITTAIESVAKEGGYAVIFDKAATLYFAEPAVDITAAVTAKLTK